MAIVTYVPPFSHIYGTTRNASSQSSLISTHHDNTGDVVRPPGRKTREPAPPGSPEGYGPPLGWTPLNQAERAAARAWEELNPLQSSYWQRLLKNLQEHKPPGYTIPTNTQRLFISTNVYRQLAGLSISEIAPSIADIPGPDFQIATLTAAPPTFSGHALTADAPNGALLFIRATNSRPGQARLFNQNDLHIPTRNTALSFITIKDKKATWTITPDTITIRPTESIGLSTRLLSCAFLALDPIFLRLALVQPT